MSAQESADRLAELGGLAGQRVDPSAEHHPLLHRLTVELVEELFGECERGGRNTGQSPRQIVALLLQRAIRHDPETGPTDGPPRHHVTAR